ncbi:hypothetical protein ASF98_18860 [Arthrobacter sp. Leaf337]|uniref:hypothetical protein n=1 Tax=Arthrobacter sp. Leaf337 TaxID=1736342 RepID=UPI0006FC8E9A|nr:hypothetical protein [Arthrobacter sp. Leaf337]KQR80356.1 hypothetical protein ASF98_18860 [Arthrobacter sp. Leaf337]
MRVPKTLIVAAGTVGIVSGALWAIEPRLPNQDPPTQQQVQQEHHDRQVGDLADADQADKDRARDEATDHINAENAQKNGAHEPRSKIRIRLP